MPKHQHYTAKNEMRMDCGHIVKAGETFHVSSVFTCDREGSWPLKVLMACFTPRAKAQPAEPPAQHETEQADPSVPANQPVAGSRFGQATVAVSERSDSVADLSPNLAPV